MGVAGVILAVRAQKIQQRQFHESGAVVAVELRGAIVGNRDPPTEAVSVTAHNKGRLGVSVTGWGALLPDGRSYVYVHPLPGNQPLDHRLEPGDRASWWMPLDALRDGLAREGLGESEIPMFVELATGERLVTKDMISVAPAGPGET